MRDFPLLQGRSRHALVAGVIAFALFFGNLLGPLDQLVWTLQSRTATFEASGEIVFLAAPEDPADPKFPERREELAEVLRTIERSGAQRVFLDVVFSRSSTAEADRRLREAMRGLGERLYLVQSYETGRDGEDHLIQSIPELRLGFQQVGKSSYINFLGHVWNAPHSMLDHGNALPSLPVAMAGLQPTSPGTYPINYSFDLASIPYVELDEVITASRAGPARATLGLEGKTILLGVTDFSEKNTLNIPGHIDVPASLVQVYAAETIKAGYTRHVSSLWLLGAYFVLLCATMLLRSARWRRTAVFVLAGSVPILVVTCALLGVRISVAASLALLLIYFSLRAKENWRNRFRLFDPSTELATFAALEAEPDAAKQPLVLIVGKIHRVEDIRRTLNAELYKEYIKKIIERLRVNSDDQAFYIDQGKYLAWWMEENDSGTIQEHLEGLRALLSEPLRVGSELVDVSMTFSMDAGFHSSKSKRLADAVAAVERSTEAFNPVVLTDTESEEDLHWNISLQASIDSALVRGEIFLLYQPKILVSTGDVVGVEALVRWNHPTKGLIPPDQFIGQCETVGRMLHLTKHVLAEACATGKMLEQKKLPLPIAVNISATLLHDRDIVGAVRDVLGSTGLDPSRLTLEITETYRIADLQSARGVLLDLADLGAKISMDDFGVGAASFEALLQLPFDELKIDRLFVSKMVADPRARAIVRQIIQLGKDLRIIVVAEGVEDPATLALLSELGGVVAQGFGIARPMPMTQAIDFARRGRAARAMA